MKNHELIRTLTQELKQGVYRDNELDEILNAKELFGIKRTIVSNYLMQMEDTSIAEADERIAVEGNRQNYEQDLESNLLRMQGHKDLEVREGNTRGGVLIAIPVVTTALLAGLGYALSGEVNPYFTAVGVGVGAVGDLVYLATRGDEPSEVIEMPKAPEQFDSKKYDERRKDLTKNVIARLDQLDMRA